jgi:dipeptidyl aminopeptidase/acylaminoacyl peptidase
MLRYSIAVFLGATSTVAVHAAPTIPLAQDARIFGKRASAWGADISPSGNKVVMMLGGPAGMTVVKVVDLNSGAAKNILGSKDSKESLDWCQFASDDYLVCRYSGNSKLDGKLVPFGRLVTIAADGGTLRQLGQKASDKDASVRQFDGGIIDWLPQQPGAVLMARSYMAEVGTTGTNVARTSSGLGVDRIDLASMKVTQVENPRDAASDYMTDGQGNVRIQVIEDAYSEDLTGKIRYKYRKAGSKNWEVLGQSGTGAASDIVPLAVEGQTNSLYLLKTNGGRDALYRMTLDGSGATTLVASNPKVDIDGVVRVGKGQKVIGYTYTDTQSRVVYFDPEYEKLANALGKALVRFPLIDIAGASGNGQRMLVSAGSDAHPGAYYLLDRTSKKMQELAIVRPDLEGRSLASVKSITYAAADGAKIPAYLTLPAGSSGKNLPAVVLPHGGPSSRDVWGFDWLPQFLAARGYAVIQPEYRGSSGYGAEFQNKNAWVNWRTAMSDIGDSARYLAREGIADPARVAIVGWSYGGYAALQSAAVEPNLYKAAVAIAPVTDLALLKKESEGYTNGRLVSAFIGNGPHIVEGSPLRNADKIKVPVLMFHGDYDINVDIEQSEKMADALKRVGAKVEFIRYEGLDHQLDDSNARTDMLGRIGTALDAAIGH